LKKDAVCDPQKRGFPAETGVFRRGTEKRIDFEFFGVMQHTAFPGNENNRKRSALSIFR